MTVRQDEYLEHYGVKGMKWGVRRYEKYDGSYTQRGVKKFREAEKNYDTARAKYKDSKDKDPEERKVLKGDVKRTKRAMDSAYKRLKNDKLADQGKRLYRSGKTITDNYSKAAKTQAAIVVGGNVTASLLSKYGKSNIAPKVGAGITIGGSAINAGITMKNNWENKRLRAYYAHSENLDDFLEHYGVKGMKWGVRKDRGSLSSRVSKARRERQAKETAKRSPERRAVDQIHAKKKAKYMTDSELKTAINRLNLESQYNRLSLEVYSPGKKFAKDFITRSSNKTADAVVQQYAIKKIRGN